jgi:hypothetical protein
MPEQPTEFAITLLAKPSTLLSAVRMRRALKVSLRGFVLGGIACREALSMRFERRRSS